MKILNIPNLITSLNLISGCLAIYFGFKGDIDLACLYIVLGAVFDFFDGMTARALGVSGPIGKELDSLADVVTFGVAPSVLCYQLVALAAPAVMGASSEFVSLAAFIMAAFSALRLAKFNCDERQTTSFIGLPTPANALFWIGLSSLAQIPGVIFFIGDHPAPWLITVLVLMLIFSFLLICEIPMFSFKFKKGHTGWAENKLRYSFLVLSIALIAVFAVFGQLPACFAAIIPLYIVVSAITSR